MREEDIEERMLAVLCARVGIAELATKKIRVRRLLMEKVFFAQRPALLS